MRDIYCFALIAETLIIGLCVLNSIKKNGRLGKCVFRYELLTFICAIEFIIFTFVPGKYITTLSKGLTMAAFDWLLLLLMYYTQYYTELFDGVKGIKLFMIVFSTLDTIMMVANTWTHSIFRVTNIQSEAIVVQFVKNSFWYKAHFIYSYLSVIGLLLIYVYMIATASRLYKFRYIVIAVSIGTGFLFDIATIGDDSIYDMSMLMYGIMSIMIYYLTFKYVPNELIENMLSIIVKDMNNGIVCFDNHKNCVYCNELIYNLYPIDSGFDKFEKAYAEWLESSKESRTSTQRFEKCLESGNKMRYFEISYKRVFDEKNKHVCDYFIFNDRTEVTESLVKEKYRASHDSLTGLLNREQFYIDAAEMIRTYKGTQFCIICSNIKDFKFVNDLFGIEKGNQVLKNQAKLMQVAASEKTICARMMNDRFAMCLPKDELSEKRMMDSVRMLQKMFDNTSFHMHIYIGIYDVTDIDESVSIMCDKANIAGDTIKDNYDCCIAHYDEHLLEKSIEERRIIGEFDKALENNEFVMFLQPQVNGNGIATGAEALVRWQHPTRGLLGPGAFIGVLEDAGLVYKLDRYIWRKAAEKLADWKERGFTQYHISVNISPKDFYMLDVYETFTSLIKEYDISPDNLKLEITETTLMADFEKNLELLGKLQQAGFKIEIDDFGSGYSSLNMLKDISADVLKIDMGFLRASENELKGQDILESIITLAGKIGMEVITEGVETKTQLSMLRQMGCNMFQGFYFSKPIPVEDFEEKYLN